MIKIGDREFTVPTPGGGETFDFQQRVIPVAGRVVAVFASLIGMEVVKDLSNIQVDDVMRVLPAALPQVGEIFARMPPGELGVIRKTLLAKATFGKLPLFGSPAGDAFDSIMAGRTMDTWKLLWHALEVWYPDFFDSVRALLVKRGEKESPSVMSTTSDLSGQPTA